MVASDDVAARSGGMVSLGSFMHSRISCLVLCKLWNGSTGRAFGVRTGFDVSINQLSKRKVDVRVVDIYVGQLGSGNHNFLCYREARVIVRWEKFSNTLQG